MKKKDICKLSNRICFRRYQCVNCQIKKTDDLGFETSKNPTKFGNYLCRCQFYKDVNEIVEEVIEWLGEWKITDTWNILGWKEIQ